jgi:DNA-directed RNA polymerase subunit RPC12/RpoP
MNCINCGNKLESIIDVAKGLINLTILGYKCPVCKMTVDGIEKNLEWTAAEHKDNQNWNVRHTRMLEQQVAELQRLLAELTIIVENHLKE